MISYDDFVNELQPFDVILFKGNDFISNTIAMVENSTRGCGKVTHVEIVINKESLPLRPGLKENTWYLLGSESTVNSLPGQRNIEGVGSFGVQIRDLRSTLRSYLTVEGTHVYWCKNTKNLYLSDKDKAIEIMNEVYNKHHGRSYDWNPLNLLASAYWWLRGARYLLDEIELQGDHILSSIGLRHDVTLEEIQLRRMFCSKFVIVIAKAMGLVGDDINPEDVVPVDLFVKCPASEWLASPQEIAFNDITDDDQVVLDSIVRLEGNTLDVVVEEGSALGVVVEGSTLDVVEGSTLDVVEGSTLDVVEEGSTLGVVGGSTLDTIEEGSTLGVVGSNTLDVVGSNALDVVGSNALDTLDTVEGNTLDVVEGNALDVVGSNALDAVVEDNTLDAVA